MPQLVFCGTSLRTAPRAVTLFTIFRPSTSTSVFILIVINPTHPPGEVAEMADQNDKKEKDPGQVDELEAADYDALKHRRKFELQV